MDEDLNEMNAEDLRSEVIKLRTGIREHRDRSGHDLCWYVPELWNLLPDKIKPTPSVPPTEEFLSKCKLYRESLGPNNNEQQWKVYCKNKYENNYVFVIMSSAKDLPTKIAEHLCTLHSNEDLFIQLDVDVPKECYSVVKFSTDSIFDKIFVQPLMEEEDLTDKIITATEIILNKAAKIQRALQEKEERVLYEKLKKKYEA